MSILQNEVSEPLLPVSKDELILLLRIELAVMSQRGQIPQVKGKGAPVSPEHRRMDLDIFAKTLGEKLWSTNLRPMRLARNEIGSGLGLFQSARRDP